MTTLDVGRLEVSAFPEIPKGYDPPPGIDDVLCKPALPFIKPEIPALRPIPALYIPRIFTGLLATFPLSKTRGITFCVKNFIPVKSGRLNEGILYHIPPKRLIATVAFSGYFGLTPPLFIPTGNLFPIRVKFVVLRLASFWPA